MRDRKERVRDLENELKTKLYRRRPFYIFSNDLFENWIKSTLKPDSVWIDAGCGINSLVEEFSTYSEHGTGIDCIIHPELKKKNRFLLADLSNLPIEDESVDTIVSNMVAEHLEDPKTVFSEFSRVLKPGGNVFFRTTNKYYPSQFFGHIFSKSVKDKIINKIFGVESHDIFRTHYKINTFNKIKKLLPSYGFEINKLEAIEDLHMFHPVAFELSYNIYRIQKMKPFYFLRNTLICWAKKP
jgi:ubiquinone/menaquinone biosynthesis C-methylase UbiE